MKKIPNVWYLALYSQIGGLLVVAFVVWWGGMIGTKPILICAILGAIVIYSLVPFFWLERIILKWPHPILWCRNVFRKILSLDKVGATITLNKDIQNIYVGILASCDLVVLCLLMLFSNGLESPFSPFLLTIPAVVFLLDFPFTWANILVFLPMPVMILLNYFFASSFASPFLPTCFLVVTIACLVVVFAQALADYERSLGSGGKL